MRKPRLRKMKRGVQSYSTQLMNKRPGTKDRSVSSEAYTQDQGTSLGIPTVPDFTVTSFPVRLLVCLMVGDVVDPALAAGCGGGGQGEGPPRGASHTCSPPMLTSSSVPLGLKAT